MGKTKIKNSRFKIVKVKSATYKQRPLEYAYKNDVVSVGTFTKSTLEKYRKEGLLKFSPDSKDKYWLTKKGLKLYKKIGDL